MVRHINCRCTIEPYYGERMMDFNEFVEYFTQYSLYELSSYYVVPNELVEFDSEEIKDIFMINDNLDDCLNELIYASYLSKVYSEKDSDKVYSDNINLVMWLEENLRELYAEYYISNDILNNKKDKGVKKMGLKIKKTDVLTIDEFKENTKPYDTIKIIIDKEKVEQYKKDFGKKPFNVTNEQYIKLNDDTIEFLPKALKISADGYDGLVNSVPYEFITGVECVYYLSTN